MKFTRTPHNATRLVHQVVHQGAVQDVDVIFRRKDGTHIHCLASGFAIRDTFGRTIRMQGTLVDITERIEIEARLHQEQEFVRRLVASFPDMIAVMDFESRFTFVSPRVEDILGHPAQELVGKLLREQIHRDEVPQLREAFAETHQRPHRSTRNSNTAPSTPTEPGGPCAPAPARSTTRRGSSTAWWPQRATSPIPRRRKSRICRKKNSQPWAR